MRKGLELIDFSCRTAHQVTLTVAPGQCIGLVLKTLFEHAHAGWLALMACIMLLAAGREVTGRPQRGFSGGWGVGLGTFFDYVSYRWRYRIGNHNSSLAGIPATF
ncbi:MAG: ABC transporter permease [Desulfatitalea sp.]|nr:ABC transporter permease [Desulfatitalea sp.]